MAKGVNPDWIKSKKKEIAEGTFKSINISYNPGAQWLITYLANRGIPVKVVQLGAGVKRITLAEKVCPQCKGRGCVD